jgi:hypothetical protein
MRFSSSNSNIRGQNSSRLLENSSWSAKPVNPPLILRYTCVLSSSGAPRSPFERVEVYVTGNEQNADASAHYYRAYLVNKADRIFANRKLNCLDDEAAVRLAAHIQEPCTLIEVWDRARLVARVEPKNKEP